MRNEWWPLFDLRIRTPRLELRPLTDEDLDELCELLTGGVHPPDQMPFFFPWTEEDRPTLQRNALRFHWRTRAEFTVESWHLPFGVWEDGRLVAQQDVVAKQFPVLRTVETGSWVGLAEQGRGIGKEMRAAVLHFAFSGLGAQRAETHAFEDNPASLAVTRSLGYEPNGDGVHARQDEQARTLRFALSRQCWETRRREDITLSGAAACEAMFGLPSGATPFS